MPDGQIFSRANLPAPHIKAQSGHREKALPLSTASYRMANERLLARNILLQSALERQQVKGVDLRSILCSMDIATICVCPALKLRLLTAEAGHLLGIGPEDVGLPFSLSGPFGLNGTLTARIKAVLECGVAESQVVVLASGQQLLYRLLPLHAFEAVEPAIDGVIITFFTTNFVPIEFSQNALPDQGPTANLPRGDEGLAAGYPDLAHRLTRRQKQVLGKVLAGHPSKNIAADLGISRRTVENHRAAIMERTGATSLPALARLAVGAEVRGDCKSVPARRARA
jgi:DNA-binding CsgD family transcriptional regulator